jgi:hypothetical protein
MRKLKFYEKILMLCLTVLFVASFFFSISFSLKPIEEDPRLFIAGMVSMGINIGIFFWTLKILKRHYDYRNHKGIRIYYYTIIAVSAAPTLELLRFNNDWMYMAVYFTLIALYVYMVNKEFGRLSIRINKDHNGDLYVGDLYSSNGDIKVRGKNKKMKSAMERVSVGDVIIVSREGEEILTLDVIKNAKKA